MALSPGPLLKGPRRVHRGPGGDSGASEELAPYPFSPSSLRPPLSLSQSLYFWPLGMVAPSREAAADNCFSVHPLAPLRLAFLRLASRRTALLRSAPSRLAPLKLASPRSASLRSTSVM